MGAGGGEGCEGYKEEEGGEHSGAVIGVPWNVVGCGWVGGWSKGDEHFCAWRSLSQGRRGLLRCGVGCFEDRSETCG